LNKRQKTLKLNCVVEESTETCILRNPRLVFVQFK
jgi:hypothetical protein